MRKGFAQLLLLAPVFVLLIASYIFFYYNQNKSAKTQTSNAASQSPNIPTTSPQSNLEPLSPLVKAHCSKTPDYPNTNNETDNWKVYVDDYLCISMKYPQGWNAYPASEQNQTAEITNYDRDKQHTDITLEKGKYLITISVIKVLQSYDGKITIGIKGVEDIISVKKHDIPDLQYKKSVINGNEIIFFTNQTWLTFEKKGDVYLVEGIGFKENRNVFDEISSTLMFLD